MGDFNWSTESNLNKLEYFKNLTDKTEITNLLKDEFTLKDYLLFTDRGGISLNSGDGFLVDDKEEYITICFDSFISDSSSVDFFEFFNALKDKWEDSNFSFTEIEKALFLSKWNNDISSIRHQDYISSYGNFIFDDYKFFVIQDENNYFTDAEVSIALEVLLDDNSDISYFKLLTELTNYNNNERDLLDSEENVFYSYWNSYSSSKKESLILSEDFTVAEYKIFTGRESTLSEKILFTEDEVGYAFQNFANRDSLDDFKELMSSCIFNGENNAVSWDSSSIISSAEKDLCITYWDLLKEEQQEKYLKSLTSPTNQIETSEFSYIEKIISFYENKIIEYSSEYSSDIVSELSSYLADIKNDYTALKNSQEKTELNELIKNDNSGSGILYLLHSYINNCQESNNDGLSEYSASQILTANNTLDSYKTDILTFYSNTLIDSYLETFLEEVQDVVDNLNQKIQEYNNCTTTNYFVENSIRYITYSNSSFYTDELYSFKYNSKNTDGGATYPTNFSEKEIIEYVQEVKNTIECGSGSDGFVPRYNTYYDSLSSSSSSDKAKKLTIETIYNEFLTLSQTFYKKYLNYCIAYLYLSQKKYTDSNDNLNSISVQDIKKKIIEEYKEQKETDFKTNINDFIKELKLSKE